MSILRCGRLATLGVLPYLYGQLRRRKRKRNEREIENCAARIFSHHGMTSWALYRETFSVGSCVVGGVTAICWWTLAMNDFTRNVMSYIQILGDIFQLFPETLKKKKVSLIDLSLCLKYISPSWLLYHLTTLFTFLFLFISVRFQRDSPIYFMSVYPLFFFSVGFVSITSLDRSKYPRVSVQA